MLISANPTDRFTLAGNILCKKAAILILFLMKNKYKNKI